MAELHRLQKILARWGVASRRQAEDIIRAGRVTVNGEVVSRLGTKVDPSSDCIKVDGRPLTQFATPVENSYAKQTANQGGSLSSSQQKRATSPPQLRYLLLNKPSGIISTCADPLGRKTVLDILPSKWRSRARWFPVGRLDAASTGALLLTNDGDLTLKLTHPRYHLPKTYRVVVEGHPSISVLQRWRNGVELHDGMTLPAKVTLISSGAQRLTGSQRSSSQRLTGSWRGRSSRSQMAGERTTLRIVLYEGRNRQIRRVAECLGHPVLALHREAIGPISLTNLSQGACRPLCASEIRRLKAEAGI
ncbi:MAG: pseudouridine synthase [Cyanobacteria bacterium P01_E01_bin.34]